MDIGENKKILIKKILVAFFIVLGLIYIVGAIYFKSHLYFKTSINSINVSGKSLNKANEEILSEIKDYKITIMGKNGLSDVISGEDIGLEYNLDNRLEEIKRLQNPLVWFLGIFNYSKYYIEDCVKFDEAKLNEKINSLQVVDENNMVKPKNATFKYENNKYTIINEDDGNYVDKDLLCKKIDDSILKCED